MRRIRPMGIFKKPTIFWGLPKGIYESLSKAALADIAWNLAGGCVNSSDDSDQIVRRLEEEIRITLTYRKAANG